MMATAGRWLLAAVFADTIAPHFKRGEFARGLDEGLDRLFGLIEGEALPPPARKAPADSRTAAEQILPLALMAAVALGGFLEAVLGRALLALAFVLLYFEAGTLEAIGAIGRLLGRNFPGATVNPNELPDRPLLL